MDDNLNPNGNLEIDKALKQFETESQAGEKPEASKDSVIPQKEVEGVKFEVPSYGAVKYYKETDVPKIVKLTMKYSGVKEQKTAEYILLGFVVLAIIVSGFFIFSSGHTQPKLTPAMI